MKLQIITYQLSGITEAEYLATAPPDAALIAQVSGLVSKVWIASPETNTYGGVYLWQSQAALNAFMESPLVAAVMARPHLTAISSVVYDVPEAPSRTTRGIA